MAKSAQKIDNLKKKMNVLEKTKTPTAEYKEIQNQIDSAEKKQSALNDRMEKFLELGGKENSKTFKSMQYDAEQLENEIKYAKSELQNLVDSGKAFTFGTDTDKYAGLSRQLEVEQNNLNSLSQKYQEYNGLIEDSGRIKENATIVDRKLVDLLEKQAEIQEHINQLKQAGVGEGYKEYDKAISDLAKVNAQINQQRSYVNPLRAALDGLKSALSGIESISKKAFSGMISLPKRATSGVLSLGKAAVKGISSFSRLQKSGINALKNIRSHSKSAGSMMGSFGNRVLGLAKRVFVFSLITKGFRAMLSGMQEGFQNYLEYDKNLKNSIEGLKASLNTVKANLGAAFAPIVQTVLPYLQMLVGWLNSAVNAVNQFISSILGRTTYKRAASGIGNVASGVSDMADNMGNAEKQAKKLAKALAHYDELNVIQRDEDTGSSSGNSKSFNGSDGLGIGYETVAIDSKIRDMADKIKRYLADIFKPFKTSWNKYGQSVIDSWKKALDNIVNLMKTLAITFRDVWTNGTGEEVCDNILLILKMIGDMLASIAKAFTNAWNDNNRGYNYVQSIFNRLNSILSIIKVIGQSLLTVWNNGSGEKIIGHLLDIFTNINNAIANIRNNFSKAWKLDSTGTKIIQDLSDLCNILLGHVNNITKGLEKWTKGLDFSPLLKAFNNITTALKPLGDKVGAGLEWLFTNVLQPLAKWAVESFIPKTLNAISSALDALDAIIDAAKPVFNWLWDNFLKPLAEWTGGTISGAIEAVGKALSELAEKIRKADSIGDVVKAFLDIGGQLIVGLFNGIIEAIKDVGNWIYEHIFEPIVNAVKGFFGIHSPSTVFEELGRYMIEGLLNGLSKIPGTIKNIMKSLWNKIQSAWKSLGNLVLEFSAKIKETAKDLWNKIKSGWNGLTEKVVEITARIKQKAADLWTGIKNAWGNAKNKVVEVAAKISQTASDLWNGIKSGWSKITNKVVEINASIKQKASDLWNSLKTGWGNTKNKVLEISAKLKESASELWNSFKSKWGNLRDTAVDVVVGIKEKAKGIWDKITGFFTGKKSASEVDETINVGTKLVKSGWTTLSKFIGEKIDVKVSLKKGFDSLKKFIGDKVNVNISLAKKGWSSISKFIGTSSDVNISLKKKGWSNIEKFVGSSVNVKIKLKKSGWKDIKSFVGTNVSVKVELKKSGWKDIKTFVGTKVSVDITLKKSGWKDIKSFVGTEVKVGISLNRSGWNDIKTFVGTSVPVNVSLKKSGWNDIKNFVGTNISVDVSLNLRTRLSDIIPSSATVYVYLSARNSIQSMVPNWVEVAVYFYAKRSVRDLVPSWVEVPTYFYRKSSGGVYKNGKWCDIPQFSSGGIIDMLRNSITRFASGGSARGTLFYAGEAGPEIVGNAGGGQSEVLNKSQIASAIYSAVVAGIRATLGNFTAVIANMVENGTADIASALEEITDQLQGIQNNYYQGITVPKVGAYSGITDVNRMNAYMESVSSSTMVNADAAKLMNALANKKDGNITIENIMYLDGKVVYQEMVDIDRMTVKQTGKSGFSY